MLKYKKEANFVALIDKLKELNIPLSDKAFSESSFRNHNLKDTLTYCFLHEDLTYIDLISKNYQSDYFLVKTFEHTNGEEWHYCNDLKDALSFALRHYNQSDEAISHIKVDDHKIEFTCEDDEFESSIEIIRSNKIESIEPENLKQVNKAFRGLHVESESNLFKRKLKNMSGFKKVNFNEPINNTGFETTLNRTLNDLVNSFKRHLDKFTLEPIKLSQAQELLVAYSESNNWHVLKKNEKTAAIPPFILDIDRKSSRYFKDNSSALYVLNNCLFQSESKNLRSGTFLISNSLCAHSDREHFWLEQMKISEPRFDYKETKVYKNSTQIQEFTRELIQNYKNESFKNQNFCVDNYLPEDILWDAWILGERFYIHLNDRNEKTIAYENEELNFVFCNYDSAKVKVLENNDVLIYSDVTNESIRIKPEYGIFKDCLMQAMGIDEYGGSFVNMCEVDHRYVAVNIEPDEK